MVALQKNKNRVDMYEIVQIVSNIVSERTGNCLGPKQYSMIENRLKSRFIELNITSESAYLEFFNENLKTESDYLVGLLTTHHTFFFREMIHFEYIKSQLPLIVDNARKSGIKTIKVWSSACSKGQEVYSIAMFLDYHLKLVAPDMDYRILGSDVDLKSVKFAENGVYQFSEVSEVPMIYLRGHLSRGKGDIRDFVKINDSIKSKCEFKFMNLMDVSEFNPPEMFDIIFCRNVLIYFDKDNVEKIASSLMKKLMPDGYLITGVSESLSHLDIGLKQCNPSVYKLSTSASTGARTGIGRAIRVFCIDDSPVVIKLLTKIFSKDGFELVGTAVNGLDAHEKLQHLNVDVVTLDIHMPAMDGIEYLRRHYSKDHPPVIMITSANRDDSDLAKKAIELGASDFVEKPTMGNINAAAEEIYNKVRTVADVGATSGGSDIDSAFQQPFHFEGEAHKLRVLIGSMSTKYDWAHVLKEWNNKGPATCIFFQGHASILNGVKSDLESMINVNVELISNIHDSFVPGKVYIGVFQDSFDSVRMNFKNLDTSILIFGSQKQDACEMIMKWEDAQILVAETDSGVKNLIENYANDILPVTSLAYVSNAYFFRKK
jgi:chemotaxis protein methyltransferase CheR